MVYIAANTVPYCDDEPVPDEAYPRGTQESANANLEEAGRPGKRDRQENPEPVGVLNPILEGSEESSAGEENRRKTANGTDGGIGKVGPGRGLRRIEAPTAMDVTNAEDALEKGDAEGPATFWEERGPFRYGL
ncbi:hypothetical protein NDU88_002618 [Pleurodeles waltl]|uniref:Uncharacterized protein n=1 Tax=Pleurodeles waltl TaxID=8319 RepID=A0AAV7MNB0_PLEWA|nr:hypothetical protein NDU88_002618 [Pleurodeles waltl]